MYGYVAAGVVILMLLAGGAYLKNENDTLIANNSKLEIAVNVAKAAVEDLKNRRIQDQIQITQVMEKNREADVALKTALVRAETYRDKLQANLLAKPLLAARIERKAWYNISKQFTEASTHD